MVDRQYRFRLKCPRCGKLSVFVSETSRQPMVNCGDCLMNDVEVVEFKVCTVTVEEKNG